MAKLIGILAILLVLPGCDLFNQSPVAVVKTDLTEGDVPLTVQFDASDSFDSDGQIRQWQWDFGDGTTGLGAKVVHIYTQQGLFIVTLTIADNGGLTTTHQVRITAGNPAPQASFVGEPATGWVPLDVQFDATASEDPNGQIVAYDWDFGDGGQGRGATPSHRYARPGRYQVMLTVKDEQEAVSQADLELRVLGMTMLTVVSTVPDPSALALGDFNGDGFADAAIASSTNDSIALLHGDGQGGFSAPREFAVGKNPRDLISADFNRDGISDLAAVSFDDATVSVFLGQRDGGLHQADKVVVGLWPFGLTAADFNNDGNIDLALTNAGDNSAMILLNDGAGQFTLAATLETGLWPSAVVSTDFDLDGIADLAVSNFFSDTVSVYLGRGDGTFQGRRDWDVGAQPVAFAVGDMDRNGFADLAVANSGDDTVSFLTGVGGGQFELSGMNTAGHLPWALVLNDFDKDGTLDLIVVGAGSGDVHAWLAAGALEFNRRRGIGVGDEPLDLQGADFDGDGVLEWVTIDFDTQQMTVLKIQ